MPYLFDYPRYAWQMATDFRTNGERQMAETRKQDLAPYVLDSQRLKILDLANGRLRPQYSILRNAGHQVYGIDFINRPQLSMTDLAYTIGRRVYTWKLGLRTETPNERRLLCGDIGKLPFADDSFDLAISAAAFEHFLDVPSVVAELHRVLRPGGLVWVSIHLFTSPSGGHNLSFTEIPLRSVPQGIDAWDHLRQRRLPFTVPLNEWRRDQYLEAFGHHFDIINHYCRTREGEELLTPEIAAELAAYTPEELTYGSYVIVARKQG